MVYLDNAATTKYKPNEVYEAFEYYIREIAVSPGRGSYKLGIEASRMLYRTRKSVAKYFDANNTNVIFTKNSTEAINMFFNGFLQKGDHVVITCYEHNAVLRPLHNLKEQGLIDYSVISRDDLLLLPEQIIEKYVRNSTRLFCATLASNLTGRVIFNRELYKRMHDNGIITFMDASQGAGKISVSIQEDSIDYIAFTGHKDLLALPGVGGLVCAEKPTWTPLLQGGTGVLGDSYVNPEVFPEAYEAGTQNMPSIWSLNASMDWIKKNMQQYREKEAELTSYFISKLSELSNVIVYDKEFSRVGVIGLNVKGIKSSDVVQLLDDNDICSRGGIHCAILAHEALGTKDLGVVRFSLGWNNSKEDIDAVISVIKKVGE